MEKKTHPDDLYILSQIFAIQKNVQSSVESNVCFASCQEDITQDAEVIIVAGKKKFSATKGMKSKQFDFINNPDGSIRWIYPTSSTSPLFLAFYNSSTIKARAYGIVVKLLFFFRFKFLVKNGSLTLFYKNELFIEKLFDLNSIKNFAFFTGTVGPNRKILAVCCNKENTISFVKIPLKDNHSAALIANENKVLAFLNNRLNKTMIIPKAEFNAEGNALYIENIKPQNPQFNPVITDVHLCALKELYTISEKKNIISETPFWKKIKSFIDNYKPDDRIKSTVEIVSLIKKIVEQINPETTIYTSIAQNDFTPWNTYLQAEKLYSYDWELAEADMPLLTDFFHFTFQSEILLKQNNYKNIFQIISETAEKTVLKDMIKHYNLDLSLYLKLYLLNVVSYYLEIYSKQINLHRQVYWLTDVWRDALKDQAFSDDKKIKRQVLINDSIEFLSDKNYAWLKSSGKKLSQLPESSDIDLLITENDAEKLELFLNKHPFISRIVTVKKSFMNTLKLYLNTGELLYLDLIYKLKRKQHILADTSEYLEKTQLSENVKILETQFEFEYIVLFYILNGSDVPEKYVSVFNLWNPSLQSKVVEGFTNKYKISCNQISDITTFSESNRNKINSKIKHQPFNRGLKFILNHINYFFDSFIEKIGNRGFIISFSGVDGAGKTTVIETLKKEITEKFRKPIVVIRHRPSLLPILSSYKYGKEEAEQRVASTLPRQGKNKSFVSSWLRFAYYLFDYLVGQVYVYFKYVLRGYVVLYDRYYFDFINDSRRTNLEIDPEIARRIYIFIYKPKLNIFLYASPEVILTRKQELSSEDIVMLTEKFKVLFSRFSKKFSHSKYICVENHDLSKTIDTIKKQLAEVV